MEMDKNEKVAEIEQRYNVQFEDLLDELAEEIGEMEGEDLLLLAVSSGAFLAQHRAYELADLADEAEVEYVESYELEDEEANTLREILDSVVDSLLTLLGWDENPEVEQVEISAGLTGIEIRALSGDDTLSAWIKR
jgi:hypothetical protein